MNAFTYSYPTKVCFGEKAAEKHLPAELAKVGPNVLLAYGVWKRWPGPAIGWKVSGSMKIRVRTASGNGLVGWFRDNRHFSEMKTGDQKMKKLRMTVDIAMTLALIGLMAYSLIGTLTHEILGVAMFALFTVHHVLNRKWFGALFKGRYKSFRIFQTALVFLLIGSVMASVISGIVLSEHVFAFLPINKGTAFARSVHMVCAYANYILMSLHLGLHWNVMLHAMRKSKTKTTGLRAWALRGIAAAIAAYGAVAFVQRQIEEYLFLKTHFLFLDPTQPIFFFFLDYMAIMGLFVFCGHYLGKALKLLDNRARTERKGT